MAGISPPISVRNAENHGRTINHEKRTTTPDGHAHEDEGVCHGRLNFAVDFFFILVIVGH